MKLYLFDDRVADAWAPFALTRPCAELRYGAWTLRERAERFAGVDASGLLVSRPWLRSFAEVGAPPVVPPETIGDDEARLLLRARFIPAVDAALKRDAAANLRLGETLVGVRLPTGHPTPDPDWFADPWPLEGTPDLQLDGELPEAPWDLIAGNAARLAADLTATADGSDPSLPPGVERLGDRPLRLAPEVTIEPGALLDTRSGPIRLDRGVEVRAGARVAGPLHAGPGSRLLGGSIGALSAGPYSYLRGEVEECVVLGYSNKAHDGFLGHALVGRWVNLGAMTTNSDLKNNYRPVRVGPPGAEVDTGLLKLGSLIGDHVKTGIGLLLNTGTVVGAGSNLFGGAMPPKWIPPFSWGSGDRWVEHRKEEFLATAELTMGRREVTVDDAVRGWLTDVWETARGSAAE